MMDNFKQECKLCDNIISDQNFKVIGVAKDVLDIILLLKMTLNDTQTVMCTMCSSKLLAAFKFKSKCLYTDNTITPYVDFKNPKPVDLKQIYAKEKGNKQGGRSLEDRDICRLCLEPVSGDHKSIQEVPVGNIEIYIPEINFKATTNPVICIKCHDALHVHSTFIKNCLDVDKKRNEDAMNGGEIFLNDHSIKTEEIEIKSEEPEEQILSETLWDIKNEEYYEGDTSLHSQTDSTRTEESKSLYELDHQKQTTAQSTFANSQSEECRNAPHKRVLERQANKTVCRNRNSKRRCLTRGLKVQEYECDKCTYNTKRKHDFMKHLIIHKDRSEVQTYKCDKCTFNTKYRRSLIKHFLKHRDSAEVQIFKCDECDYKSTRKDHLKQHQLTHKDPSEVRVFKCDECDYKSKRKGSLKQHQLTHKDPSELKMFKCDKCTYETRHKNSLIFHCLTHKDPSEVRMLKCDECDYKCIQKGNLHSHQLRHKDPSEVRVFKCDECKFTTKRKGTLKQHQLTHRDPAEVRVFQCDACDYKSIRKAHLKEHQLRHKDPSEVRVFQCDECDYKSKQKINFKQHQLTHKTLRN